MAPDAVTGKINREVYLPMSSDMFYPALETVAGFFIWVINMSDSAVASYIDVNNQTQRVGPNTPLPILDAAALFILQTIMSQLPATLGQTTGSLSLPVVLPSDTPVKALISSSASTIVTNQVAIVTGGTQVQLSASTTALSSGVTIKAAQGNVSPITIGLTSVSVTVGGGNGYVLQQGESIFIPISILSVIYINGATAGDYVSFIAS